MLQRRQFDHYLGQVNSILLAPFENEVRYESTSKLPTKGASRKDAFHYLPGSPGSCHGGEKLPRPSMLHMPKLRVESPEKALGKCKGKGGLRGGAGKPGKTFKGNGYRKAEKEARSGSRKDTVHCGDICPKGVNSPTTATLTIPLESALLANTEEVKVWLSDISYIFAFVKKRSCILNFISNCVIGGCDVREG